MPVAAIVAATGKSSIQTESIYRLAFGDCLLL